MLADSCWTLIRGAFSVEYKKQSKEFKNNENSLKDECE